MATTHSSNPEYLLHKLDTIHYKSSRVMRYGAAILISSGILLVQYLFQPYLSASFLDAFLAVIIVAWYGGLGPGLIATFICVTVTAIYFQPIHGLSDIIGETKLIAFVGQGALLSIICELNQQRDRAMRRLNALYENLLSAQSDLNEGVVLIQDNEVIYVNEAVERITGYAANEITDFGFILDHVVPEQRESVIARMEHRSNGGTPSSFPEVTIVDKSGRRIDLDTSIKASQFGNHVHLIVLIRDVTERKRMEETLRRSEEHYRLLIENVKDYAIFTLKKNGEIASWNEGAERILGYDEEEMVGKHVSVLFSPEGRKKKLPEEQLIKAEKEGRSAEQSWHQRKDGSLFFASGITTPLFNSRGKLRGYIKVLQDISDQKEREESMEHQALHDSLTDLPNRTLFCDRLDRAIISAKRKKQGLAVIYLDLDKFKSINDTLGHARGDLVLQEVAQRLAQAVRKQDSIARIHGDEFTLLLPEITAAEDCQKIMKKIAKSMRQPFVFDEHQLHVNVSMGAALYPEDGEDVQSLLKNADTALYQAKGMGRNTYQFYTSTMNLQADKNLTLESELRLALDRGEFVLYYQPIIDALTEKVAGVEALVRWNHPHIGLIHPGDFIPLAEENGLIIPLNEWIMKAACRQSVQWQAAGLPPLTMSVNVSVRQFTQKNLVEKISTIVKETGMPPGLLELEVTESFAMHDIKETTSRLLELRAMGVNVAIDDFGTGHSSLNYLKHLPINTLKIDHSFIKGCVTSRQDAEIVKAISAIGHSLGLKVVAEGVETSEQLEYVKTLGCELIQGFLFSEPLPVERLEELVRKGAV
ncbi:MAG: EAL domain-containing protein [bacterium]